MTSRRLVTALVLLVGLLVVPASSALVPASAAPRAPAATNPTTLLSVTSDGTQANGDSDQPVISADGRYFAFESVATNLVPGDTNNAKDAFVRDRVTGATTRVNVASDGTQADGESSGLAISADGRYVAFDSPATNLVAGDTNQANDLFVHDRVTGATTRVSVASDGAQASGDSFFSTISADGRYVAFSSQASNLVAGDTNQTGDVFVHDRVTGATTRVSVTSDGAQANNLSDGQVISADGRYVAFYSDADNLVAGDTNKRDDVFVHDRVTGATTRVNVTSDGAQANDISDYLSISADGRYVGFYSPADNLVAGDTNQVGDVFMHDRVTGATTRVSVTADGGQANDNSLSSAISADGRYVAFDSYATNLVAGDTNDGSDVFVHDRLPTNP